MLTCVIIEDQLPARKLLQKYINDLEGLTVKATFSNAISALDFLKENPIDILFLDIHLPKLSGIDFLGVLSNKPYVILTTAFSDYAIQSYELDVVDYLLKPFSFERFVKAVMKVQRLINQPDDIKIPGEKENESMLVKIGYEFVKIKTNEIAYIQADGDYTHVFCQNEKFHASYTLKYWIENLPSQKFFQVHRSYLVNVHQIQKVTSGNILIRNKEIPIGRVFKKDFQKMYLDSQN